MLLVEGLVEVEPLTNTRGGVVEIFRSPIAGGVFDDNFLDLTSWDNDVDGAGLLLFIFEGKRTWIKTSVSKTPFSFLKKSLISNDSEYLKHVVLIRGTEGYPLADKEIKSLAGLLNGRLKDTTVQLITSYVTSTVEQGEIGEMLDNALADVTELLEVLGLDLTQVVNESIATGSDSELKSGTEEVTVNGLTVSVQSRLTDENAPEDGLEYVSVRVTTPEGKTVVFASTGAIASAALPYA